MAFHGSSDAPLIRRALKALVVLMDGHDGPHEFDLNESAAKCSRCVTIMDKARTTITKLEERLLRE